MHALIPARPPRRFGVVAVHPLRVCVSTRFLQIAAASAARAAALISVAGAGRLPDEVARAVVFAFEREAARTHAAGRGGGGAAARHVLDTPVFFESLHVSAVSVCVRFVARGIATARGDERPGDVGTSKISSALAVRHARG